jgi:hypothetical protein
MGRDPMARVCAFLGCGWCYRFCGIAGHYLRILRTSYYFSIRQSGRFCYLPPQIVKGPRLRVSSLTTHSNFNR